MVSPNQLIESFKLMDATTFERREAIRQVSITFTSSLKCCILAMLSISHGLASSLLKAFVHTWRGYEKYAWGHDELKPVTNKWNDDWGGFGVTILDSIDT
jgi:hypothetical protein